MQVRDVAMDSIVMTNVNFTLAVPTVYALRLSASTASTWDIQYFPLPALEQHFSSAVARARLYMHLPAAPMPVEDNGHAWINVYSVPLNSSMRCWLANALTSTFAFFQVSVDKKGHTFLNQEAAAKVRLYPGHGGWTEVDVWELTALWFKHPAENMGLVIQVNTAAGQALKVGVQHQPQLVRCCSMYISAIVAKQCVLKKSKTSGRTIDAKLFDRTE